MATLTEFKTENPAYKDVPDSVLATKIYQKFYSDKMSVGDFYKKIDYTPPTSPMMSEAAADPASRNQTSDQMIAQSGYQPKPDIGERIGMGAGDPVYGAAQLGARLVPDFVNQGVGWLNRQPIIGPVTQAIGLTPVTPEGMDKRVQQREANYEAARGPNAGFDWARLGGNVAATLPMVFAAPEGTMSAALTGAMQGALQPVTSPGDFLSQKGLQSAIGAGAGAGTNLAGRAISSIIAPKVSPEVQLLMDKGVTPTPGQVLGGGAKAFEDKMTSIPLLGDIVTKGQKRTFDQFNRAVYQDVLAPIGETAPKNVGRDAVSEITAKLSNAYDDLLPKLNFKADQQFFSEINNLTSLVKNLPDREARFYTNFLSDKIVKALGPAGQMDGLTFKGIESGLGKAAVDLGKSSDFYQQQLGTAFQTLLKSFREGLERSNAGPLADRLQAINAGWARLVRLQKAAGSLGQESPGTFTPAQFLNAVKASDRSVRKGAFSRGDALMQDLADAGKKVLGNTYPNSGTPGRQLAAWLLAGGSAALNPHAAVGGLMAMAPYTGLGQKVAASLLTKRPAFAPQVARSLMSVLPAAQVGLAAALANR